MLIWYQLKPSNIKVINLTRLNFAAVHLVLQYSIKNIQGSNPGDADGHCSSSALLEQTTHFPLPREIKAISVTSYQHSQILYTTGTGDMALVTTKSIRTAQITPGVDFVEAPQGNTRG